MHWQKVTLVGVGLLGGSLGLALRQRRLATKVDGYVRRSASIGECEKIGAVDHATRDLNRAVENADLVVLCTPLGQMREMTEKMLPALKKGAIVTDVGSVKETVVEELEPLVAGAGAFFVGSHPMAGGEKMGVAAAREDLFNNAICIVTPTQNSDKDAVRRVEELWKSVGSRPVTISPVAHDDLVSRSSHLPHVVAAELANYVLSPAHPKEQSLVCANGFRDTTRIASGSPEMWRDISMANRKNLSRVLGVFIEDLTEFQLALDNGDVKAIEEFFEKAKQRRDAWTDQKGASSE
ncbi:prephenate dehydrogenase [Pedosphaera parvula]|uniref:Prephenate dehydrogenase n=1 Tax=Pedosphaera parvula (strain Ellin514) TaxID=320771 RepID=B9XMY9_PEDPL|nr:prephenate dehydrogenase/arogenate dehydrogenase family protein [Pedosphaera parvula]EEF58785.1 Prephenate dehydrogenase [Pedosphaera parvula Ellin514]